MFCEKCGRRLNANFIRNPTKCDKIHVQYDIIIQKATKSMFSEKCGSRVKANSIQNVIKYMRNVIKTNKIHAFSEVRQEGQGKCVPKCVKIRAKREEMHVFLEVRQNGVAPELNQISRNFPVFMQRTSGTSNPTAAQKRTL